MPPSNGIEKPLGFTSEDLTSALKAREQRVTLARSLEQAEQGTVTLELRRMLTSALSEEVSPLDGVPELQDIVGDATTETPTLALAKLILKTASQESVATNESARFEVAGGALIELRASMAAAFRRVRGGRASGSSLVPRGDW